MSMKPRKTPQKEHLEWMKEAGYTVADMDRFWAENYGTNSIVTNLTDHGMSWRDMNLCVVQKLPTQKERDAEAAAKKAEEQRIAEEAARKEKEAKEYFEAHFEELMLDKIIKSEDLTPKELRTLVYEYGIETEYGEDHRWAREAFTVIKLSDIDRLCHRYFGIDWMKSLTEMGEDEFYNQPYEVKQIEHVTVVKEWIPIDDAT